MLKSRRVKGISKILTDPEHKEFQQGRLLIAEDYFNFSDLACEPNQQPEPRHNLDTAKPYQKQTSKCSLNPTAMFTTRNKESLLALVVPIPDILL